MKGLIYDGLRISLLLVIGVFGSQHVYAATYEIDAATWQQPRSAKMLKSLPAIKSAIEELLATESAKLVIRHNNDEEGALWGTELHDWLVSLGIQPARMRLEASTVSPAAIQLDVVK